MNTDDLRKVIARDGDCVETHDGWTLKTHCLYPSFSEVSVKISRLGDGFRVSDGGGAVLTACEHLADSESIDYALGVVKAKYHITEDEGDLVCEISDPEWLKSAILSVANGSALAVVLAMERSGSSHLAVTINDDLIGPCAA